MIGIHTSPMDHLGLLCLKLGHVGSARTLRDLRGNKDGLVVFRRKCADRLEISAECTYPIGSMLWVVQFSEKNKNNYPHVETHNAFPQQRVVPQKCESSQLKV